MVVSWAATGNSTDSGVIFLGRKGCFYALATDLFYKESLGMKKVIVSLCGFGLLAATLVGCGGGVANAPANISGKVTYKGAPVTGGVVGFFATGTEGGGYSATISPDGTYSTSNIPAGEIKVTVETESLNPNIKPTAYTGGASKGPAGTGAPGGGAPKKMGASPMPGNAVKREAVYVKIPGKYAKKDTTTLKATLKAGSNKVDLDLVD